MKRKTCIILKSIFSFPNEVEFMVDELPIKHSLINVNKRFVKLFDLMGEEEFSMSHFVLKL